MGSKRNRILRTATRTLAMALALAASMPGFAWESDVHFGLTKWLALQAGYTAQQSDFIATGNQRADSGLMASMALAFEYACLSKSVKDAGIAQRLHFPRAKSLPEEPALQKVVPGGDASMKTTAAILGMAPDKAGLMLYKFGEAIHSLQDSWSHQGKPGVPTLPDVASGCDTALSMAHSDDRGGWNSHKADLTAHWPEDVVAMAAATYRVLQEYPPIQAQHRVAKPWNEVRPPLVEFIEAPTKTAKAAWFIANGIAETAFLGGTTLPDGTTVWKGHRSDRKLPPLTTFHSQQYGISTDIIEFFEQFFTQWLSSDDFDRLVATGPLDHSTPAAAISATDQHERAQLLARLKLWRVRDHGLVAGLAHADGLLDKRQLARVDELTRDPKAYVHYDSLKDAFFPLVTQKPSLSPLLPFILHVLDDSASGRLQAIALVKLRHVPYDTLAVKAEKIDGNWLPVAILPMVEH